MIKVRIVSIQLFTKVNLQNGWTRKLFTNFEVLNNFNFIKDLFNFFVEQPVSLALPIFVYSISHLYFDSINGCIKFSNKIKNPTLTSSQNFER